jgi:hypothetical protein
MNAVLCALCDKNITSCCLNLWCKKHKQIKIETLNGEIVTVCQRCVEKSLKSGKTDALAPLELMHHLYTAIKKKEPQ